MSKINKEEKVIKIFSDIFKDQEITISRDTLLDDLDLDSLDVLDILMRIKNETNYDLSVETFAICKNLGEVVDYID